MEIPDSVDHSQLQMSAIKVKKEIEMQSCIDSLVLALLALTKRMFFSKKLKS